MTTATSDMEEIRRRMTRVRRGLRSDVRELVAGGEALVTGRRYLRDHSWALLAAAGVAGYLLVPRRRRPAPRAETPAPEPAGPPEVAPAGAETTPVPDVPAAEAAPAEEARWPAGEVLRTAWSILLPVAVRAAQSYAAHHVEAWIARQHQATAAAGPRPPADGPFAC